MKFDVIVGNPPYQNQNQTNKYNNLWSQFVDVSVETLLSDNGYLAMITPPSWMSPGDRKVSGNLLQKVFLKYQLVHLEVNTIGHYFPNVGSAFSWYIIKKTPYVGPTRGRCGIKKTIVNFEYDFRGFNFIPLKITDTLLSIVQKVIIQPSEKIDFHRATTLHTGSKRSQRHISSSKTATHTYPLMNTSTIIVYSDIIPPMMGISKVWIPISGHPRPIADSNGEFGVTNNGLYVACSNAGEVVSLTRILSSKLFQFIMRELKWSGFNSAWIIRQLPKVDTSHSWTDAELYRHFNLTDEEIKLIEDTVK